MSSSNKALIKAIVLADKTVRTSLDATYAIEDICGHMDVLKEENTLLAAEVRRLKKALGSQQAAYEKLSGKKMKKMELKR